jgi:hypothetical protein
MMEDIKKYADLIALLDASAQANVSDGERRDPAPDEEDTEALEWASLLARASTGITQKARLKLCVAGLAAVHRHIAGNPSVDR